MYRNRNLDVFVAGATALLGGAAYVLHAPGPVQVVLGIALFFAPGYLWSEAILSQLLSGLERVMVSAGVALILPILGGFLFYGLKIPLFRSSWVGLLVVLTLLGVVAVAVQRLREVPAEYRREEPPRRRPEQRGALSPLHVFIYGLAAVIGLGAVAFSVKNADAQKFPGTSALSMTAVLVNPPLTNQPLPTPGQTGAAPFIPPTRANLVVSNHEGVAEEYQLKLYRKKKLINTWNFTLSDGGTWQRTIAYSVDQGDPILANLYLLPDTSKPVAHTDNGE